jgi:hypothetical protein
VAQLYPSTPVTGYNANPPPDDGTQVSTNLERWSDVKTKIGDPLNVFAGAVDGNLTAAFGKTLDGATVVSTGTTYVMSAADQGRLIVVTVAGVVVTTPSAAVVGAPFTFAISNQSNGTITLDGFGAQTVDGLTVQTLKAGSGAVVKTDGSNWFTFGLKPAQLVSVNPPFGFDVPVNLGLVASVNAGILTVAIKTNSGNDPSPGDPVLIPYRDATVANGDPVWIAITAALSINTNAIGATLQTQNSTPFRFWICACNNAGTPVLALWHSGVAAPVAIIRPLDESSLQSATGISAAATSAGVFYCPNGTTLTNVAVRKIGFLDYVAGLATAGNYNIAPTKLQLYGPGIPSPGTVIQSAVSLSINPAITISNAVNAVKIFSHLTVSQTGTAAVLGTLTTTLKRGATTLDTAVQNIFLSTTLSLGGVVSLLAIDAPGTTTASYALATTSTNGGAIVTGQNATMLDEIMA